MTRLHRGVGAIGKGLLVLCMLGLSVVATADVSEIRILRRIPLKENLNPDFAIRVMQFSSMAPMLPQKYVMAPQGSFVNNAAQPPGAAMNAAQATAANILGALIYKAVSENEQKNIHEFREKLADVLEPFDLSSELSQEINGALAQANFHKVAMELVPEETGLEQPGLLVRIQENDIVTISAVCYFNKGERNVNISATVRVWKKDVTKPVYFTEMRYSSPSLPDPADPHQAWLDGNGALVVDYLREGVHEVGRMFALELLGQGGSAAMATSPLTVNWQQPFNGKTVSSAFYLLDDGPQRIIGRPYSQEAGLLLSIPRDVATPIAQ